MGKALSATRGLAPGGIGTRQSFLWCDPLQSPRRIPAPGYCISSRKLRSFEVPGRRGNQQGRGRPGGGKKKEKRTRKKCSVRRSYLHAAHLGTCEGSRLVGGTRLVVFPRCLTPYRPKNTTSRDPYPPSSRDPPFRPGPLPLLHLFGKGKGQGVPAREGVPARGSLELWAVWPWEYHEPGPPNEPGPLDSPDHPMARLRPFTVSHDSDWKGREGEWLCRSTVEYLLSWMASDLGGGLVGPTNPPQSIAVKESWCSRVDFEFLMCGGICVEFLVANLHGN